MTVHRAALLIGFLGFVMAEVGVFVIYRPAALVVSGVALILLARAGLRN
jgi:hypothetical protein